MPPPRTDLPPKRRTVPSYPLFLALFGVPGTAKTTQLLTVLYGMAMRGRAKVAAQPNGIASFETATGLIFPSKAVEIFERIDQVTAFTVANKGKLWAIGHDDASAMLDESYAKHEAESPVGQSGKKDAFHAPREIKADITRLKTASRFAGAHVICTYHEQSRSIKKDQQTGEDKLIRGGTKVPNKELVNFLLGALDGALRAVPEPTAKPFPGVYYYKPNDPLWAVKDRVFGCCDAKTPLNLGELMRHRSIEVPRHQDPKMDAHIEAFVQDLAMDCWSTGNDGPVMKECLPLLVAELGPEYASWVVDDAMARVAIWRKQQPQSSPEAAIMARWGIK